MPSLILPFSSTLHPASLPSVYLIPSMVALIPMTLNVAMCANINGCDGHHKNINRIGNALYSEHINKTTYQSKTLVVLWTDHAPDTFCVEENTTHSTISESTFAVTYGDDDNLHYPVFTFFALDNAYYDYFNSPAFSMDVYMGVKLAHEVGHTFGLAELYDRAYHEEIIANNNPVMPDICEKYEVRWDGPYCFFFAIYIKNGDRGAFRKISQELLYKNYKFHDLNYRSSFGDLLSDETENNIRTLKRQKRSVIYTMRIYTITEDNITYDFCEWYKTNASGTILAGFDVVIRENDTIHLLSCNTITEPLSLDIVKQFDLIPYTE